jgi:DNA-binding MarR family transcriptional regulator
MKPEHRRRQAEREKRKAAVRGTHLEQLAGAGALRTAALEQADRHLDRIAKLLPDALAGGLSLAEIARVTGVSRPTLYELKGRYGERVSDLRLALLQAVATKGPIPSGELRKQFGHRSEQLTQTLRSFEERGLIEYFPIDDDQDDVSVDLTPEGLESLEHWFEHAEQREAGA